MKRSRLLIGLAILVVIGASGLGLRLSGAAFTSAKSSTISATSSGIWNLVHIYSQSTDPAGLTGYYVQPLTGALAATGADGSLAANLGRQTRNTNVSQNRVFTIQAASSFPSGITQITVTRTIVEDPDGASITAAGFANLGATTRSTSVNLTPGAKRQFNTRTRVTAPSNTVFTPSIVLTVTYTGYSGTFFRYTVPFTVTAR